MRRLAAALVLALLAGPAQAQAPAAAAPNGAPPATAPAAPPAPEWLPQGSVDLRALDKVTARTSTLTGKVGDTLHFGTLTILVRACVVRPPDHAPDAAAFLDIIDSNGGNGFRGWMLASVPSLGMLEHPVYDIEVAACHP